MARTFNSEQEYREMNNLLMRSPTPLEAALSRLVEADIEQVERALSALEARTRAKLARIEALSGGGEPGTFVHALKQARQERLNRRAGSE